ncbi:serine hydrolase [Microtetraspora malaysiensis]|uniref:serine hydrolase domain-containing protein n=1 Tax=Microtetraspora malaysiensis TaxID=161358 RepID=UPI003D8C151A
MAKLAAEGKFSGVVLLSHQGRTVLSRSYGMADKEKGIRNHEGVAFSLSSAGKPFEAVAILQLAQQGKLRLSDTVGTHLKGFAKDIAERVTIHHLLSGTAAATAEVDVAGALAWRDFMVSGYSDAGQEKWLAGKGIALLRGHGQLAGPGAVEVGGARYTADRVGSASRAVVLHQANAVGHVVRGVGRAVS